ncbi:tRNA1(Val) (adenine(37)-N6)-methyltransferase [Algoriphagus pacificus]|uniref:tRNA1(Val) (adenine(37)-N6)-methyltransferase n=1 Tax=Algoriphagus pacificus TaxID=2811234 RepID=A0ABS3CBU2_9BACT|nr:methyltransferase [Algoriphagus pacificus]MBN7814001.1 methyltransferase [Algoriphagus pacificus]
MANSWFQFQQFRINQDRCAMKISTDAVLLGGLATAENPKMILDVGTGTGVIALMLAQRFDEAQITAVELDQEAADQAKDNFEESVFAKQLSIWRGKFQDFSSPDLFNLIVSNPPYFPHHLKSQDQQRNQALHTDELSFEDLVISASKLLERDGEFWVILPERQMMDFEKVAAKESFFLNRKYLIRDRQEKKILRMICSFSFHSKELFVSEIIIKNPDGSPHESYSSVVSGFLLGF